MAQKKRDPSFDAVIRLFMQKYDIPTKQDLNRLIRKIEDLEKALSKKSGAKEPTSRAKKGQPAAKVVLNIIKDIGEGATVADIKAQTDYDNKKVQNIVHRLNKEGKIKRKERGVYVAG